MSRDNAKQTDSSPTNVSQYRILFTSGDSLLTSDRDGKCDYMIDDFRKVIWIDSRYSAEFQLTCIKTVLRLIFADRQKILEAARARRAKKRTPQVQPEQIDPATPAE